MYRCIILLKNKVQKMHFSSVIFLNSQWPAGFSLLGHLTNIFRPSDRTAPRNISDRLTKLKVFFFEISCSISSKNSSNSIDAHLCFISKIIILPERKKISWAYWNTISNENTFFAAFLFKKTLFFVSSPNHTSGNFIVARESVMSLSNALQ